MNRHRVTEEPGVWRLLHQVDARKLTLQVLEGPGVRARTIEIIADGAIRIDGKVIMSALTPRLRRRYTKRPEILDADILAIANEVAEASGVSVAKMRGPLGRNQISQARKVAMFLAEQRLKIVHSDIAKFFNRERSTISGYIADVVEQVAAARSDPRGLVTHGIVTEATTF